MLYKGSRRLKRGIVAIDLKHPCGIHEHIVLALMHSRIAKKLDAWNDTIRAIRRIDVEKLRRPFDI